jgi:hypothetical protein
MLQPGLERATRAQVQDNRPNKSPKPCKGDTRISQSLANIGRSTLPMWLACKASRAEEATPVP